MCRLMRDDCVGGVLFRSCAAKQSCERVVKKVDLGLSSDFNYSGLVGWSGGRLTAL